MEREFKKTKIIYIAGYGRSGSTLLDIVLSNANNGITLGEIGNVFYELNNTTDCYYASILNDVINELGFTKEQVRQVQYADRNPYRFNVYYNSFWKIFLKKFEVNQTDFLIDSSKTTWYTLFRPHNLQKIDLEVHIIFLKVSYYKVWKSALKGSNKELQKSKDTAKKKYFFALKSIISKFFIDNFTRVFYNRKKYKILNVYYEDFISDPKKLLDEISEKFQIQFVNLNERVTRNEFLVKDGYLGNRMRKKGTIIKIKKDC